VSLQLYIQVSGNMVMGVWTSTVSARNYSDANFAINKDGWYAIDSSMMGIIGLIMLASFLSMLGGAFMFANVRVKVARNTHAHMLKRVLYAPVSFFDVTPLGRILNRFTSDQKSVDFFLSIMMMWSVVVTNMLISAFLAMAASTQGLLLIVFVPLGISYYYMVNWVRHVSIELQRIEANARSPIYTSFSEILAGLITVRSFQEEPRFMEKQMSALDGHIQPYFMVRGVLLPWLTLRINCMSAVLLGSIGAFALFLPRGFIEPGLLGVAMTYSLIVDNFLRIVVFISIELEVQMNSVERIKYYGDKIPVEAPSDIPETAPPQSWPSEGRISVEKLVMGYRDGPDVLKGVSFHILPRQKVALVGRTGSGKSSLLIALFRISEPRAGRITIDGVDVSTLGLRQLRSRLGIIPQDPVLFTGSLRHNLDPFKNYSDDRLWEVLTSVEMQNVVEALPGQLMAEISEGGRNFSVGQRQLLCMARALLLDPKVLLLDEATASLDSGTDAILQRMIRVNFADKTVLTIAHRLDTIMDSDMVLVMDDGRVGSFASPTESLEDKDGIFYSLVYAEGETRGKELVAMIGAARG
jgi:ATP-binding cassette subfamily C (CFTR/MRP) protein 1